MRLKGSITVFLSLSLFAMLSLILASLESARFNMARAKAAMASDLGIDSIFAEFNRELLSKYDLYFIDTSYGGNNPSTYNTEEHLRHYVKKNLTPPINIPLIGPEDFANLELKDSKIDSVSYATDDGGRVFKRQAIHAIKDHYGISIIDDAIKKYKSYDESKVEDYDVDSYREELYEEIGSADIDQEGCPVNEVFDKRAGILELILESESSVSNKELDLRNTASHRSNAAGVGLIKPESDVDSITNEALFNEYLCWKLSCYTKNRSHNSSDYELEYILNGENTDIANLREMVKKIFLLREAADTIAALRNESMREQAKVVGVAVSVLLLMPELEEPITNLILCAWGFAEAVVDVKTLLAGGKIPLIKGETDWRIATVVELPFFLTFGPDRSGASENLALSYLDYLKIFLLLQTQDEKCMRAMDIIELNMRTLEGNESFRMDACAEYLQAEMNFESRAGYEFEIRREYGYERVAE
ncbi:MAG: hypothetical protein J6P05_01495 [Lachnospiraceae bacterium]|nr:hypothetical protein [Lachnospiraceae bacterium]